MSVGLVQHQRPIPLNLEQTQAEMHRIRAALQQIDADVTESTRIRTDSSTQYEHSRLFWERESILCVRNTANDNLYHLDRQKRAFEQELGALQKNLRLLEEIANARPNPRKWQCF